MLIISILVRICFLDWTCPGYRLHQAHLLVLLPTHLQGPWFPDCIRLCQLVPDWACHCLDHRLRVPRDLHVRYQLRCRMVDGVRTSSLLHEHLRPLDFLRHHQLRHGCCLPGRAFDHGQHSPDVVQAEAAGFSCLRPWYLVSFIQARSS